jgi:subtilisin-like proprotein convertase family protein
MFFALVGVRSERYRAAASHSIPVKIDVLPGEASKLIDGSTRTIVPVAIFSSNDFDATTVNPASVVLADAPITKNKKGRLRWALMDVNGDGRTDLIVYVSVFSLHLDSGSSEAVLTATTFDGESISGAQRVSFNKPEVEDPPVIAMASMDGTVSNSSSITINDSFSPPTKATPYPSNITVSGQSTITKLTVSISNFSHTFPDDVDILLVGPTGATCLLMADCGGSDFVNNLNLTFDDSFLPLPDDSQISSGTYSPTKGTCPGGGSNCVPANFPTGAPAGPYGASLSTFNGTNPNGTWQLYVIDDSGGDNGLISGGWALTFNTPSAFQGFNDGAGCNTISGWAWDANNPNGTVSVDIYDGNTLIGTSPANMYREDLLNVLGSPNHGFSFLTPASVKDGAVHTIKVKFAGTNTLLANTTRTVQCTQAPNFFGRHDGQGCNAIEGWAWDGTDPNGTVNVDIYDGATLIGTVACTLYRQDLADNIGSPYHGFIFHTPASLRDGQPHTITVKFGGTNTNITLDTPRTTSCTSGTTNYQGNLDSADCNFISGFAWDANDDQGTINAAIYVDGAFYVVVPAQEAYAGVGTGFHGFKFAVPASLKDGQTHSITVKFSGTSTSLSGTPKSIHCP